MIYLTDVWEAENPFLEISSSAIAKKCFRTFLSKIAESDASHPEHSPKSSVEMANKTLNGGLKISVARAPPRV